MNSAGGSGQMPAFRIWLVVLGGLVWLAGGGVAVAVDFGSIDVVLDAVLLEKPAAVSGHVDITTAQPGELEVTVEWVDSYGRVADRQVTTLIMPGATTVNFSFTTEVGLSMVNQIVGSAVFPNEGYTLSGDSESWELVLDPVDHQDYHVNVWGGGDTSDPDYFDALEESNVNFGHIYRAGSYDGHNYNVRPNHDFIEDKKWFEMTDTMHDPNYSAYKSALQDGTYWMFRNQLIRPQSLSSASSLNDLVNTITPRMQYTRNWRPLQWNISDEYGIGRRASPFDYDLGADCISQFIVWLQDEYLTIEVLN